MFRSRKKENVPIELSLDFNEALGVSSVTAIATSILKHILYQRRQVPLVVEVLEREAALDIPLKAATTASVSELRLTDNNEESASSRRRNTIQLSRERQARLKQERLWNKYAKKVKQFVKNLEAVTQALESELSQCPDVQAVRLALGGSSVTAREVYTLILPPRMGRPVPHNIAKIRHTLFRAFLMNEELTSVMNSYCCLKKIWILLLKPYNLHSCNTTNFHSHDGAMTSTVTPVWFPKPGFKPSSLAKIVNIQIQYPFKPDDLNSEQIFQPSTSTFSSEQFHSNQECGASHDLVSEHVATDRTPVRRRGGLGRRVLPSLARRLVREQEGGSSSVLDPLLQDMEQFGLSHLEVSASSPYFDNTFLKPTVPINGKSCNKKITKLRVYEKNIPDEETSLDTDFSVVDMVQTPIASDRLSNYSNKSFARSSVGSNSNFKTPFHNYPDNNSDRTCEKLIPIPMVETPIFSDKSLRFESLLATRVSSQVVSGLPHSKRWCPDPMNHTPLNSTYNHIGPFSSDKIYPISMIETPIVSQPPSDVDTPYTENDIAMSTYEKRDSAFMLKTPIETERCFRNASTHVELTTSTNVHPQSMIETPVIQGIRNILETPMAHLGLSTSKKIFPVSMIETPILTERKDIERRKNNIVEYHDYMSNSVSLIETSVALNRKIVFETPISRLVKAEQLPTGKKMDSISMTETSIDSEKMCYNSTPNQFFEDTHELPTCRKLSPQSMIGTPITSHQPNTMTYASPDNMPNNFNKPLNQASQEYEIEEDLTCANKCEPLNNYFVEDGAASTSNTCISQKSSSYIWYQLSIPLVGFTEKPVARPKVGDQQDDDDDPLDFL